MIPQVSTLVNDRLRFLKLEKYLAFVFNNLKIYNK